MQILPILILNIILVIIIPNHRVRERDDNNSKVRNYFYTWDNADIFFYTS